MVLQAGANYGSPRSSAAFRASSESAAFRLFYRTLNRTTIDNNCNGTINEPGEIADKTTAGAFFSTCACQVHDHVPII
jgi:hypothetical protein